MTTPAQIQANHAQIARIKAILRGGLDHPLIRWLKTLLSS